MKRRTLAVRSTNSFAAVEALLLALLTATERHEPTATAGIAFLAAMRSQGRDAAKAGGTEALDYLLIRVCDDDPSKADVREVVLASGLITSS
ncbi:hypothetical protein MKK68_25085 [Methylobacterium sp. E-016]|uniref:hypothetical protein n=1 Tax=Methylobacterium sp. E-016 TaxID=2836556 RepID=UPI001FB9E9C6|nr:hypothetical protein [Methylobacterium sp. E-016]MCJ2078871.1 hypothetical protein [Methylobacterium sp. E-016]